MNDRTPPFPAIHRVVTAHDDKAEAVVAIDDSIHGKPTAHGPIISLLWSTAEIPPDVSHSKDNGLVNTGLSNNGTIIRVVDFPPRSTGMTHRSITLDYIYVIKGEIVLTLDDGSRTPVKQDGVVIQQATMHGWDNETDEWTRLLCILIHSQAPLVGGTKLKAHTPFQV